MNFLRRLRAAWLFSQYNSYREPQPPWSPEDADTWKAFRQTPTGRKLGMVLNNMVWHKAIFASNPGQDMIFQAGAAFGTRATIADIQSLMSADNFRSAEAQFSDSEADEEQVELRSSLS